MLTARRTLMALVLLAVALPARGDNGAQPARDAARRAYQAYETVLYDPPRAPREGDRTAYLAAVDSWQSKRMKMLDEFVATFEKTDWEGWSPSEDIKLLETGLLSAGERAYEKGEGDRAIRAYEMLIRKVPDARRRMIFPVRKLPLSYLKAGRIDEGRRRTEELIEVAPPMYRPRLLVLAGDFECLLGNTDAARELYRRCWESVPDKLKECCGTEADSARDAWVKLAVLAQKVSLDGAAWSIGTVPAPRPGKMRVVSVIDLYRGWDVNLAGRAHKLLAKYPDVLAGSAVVSFAEDTGDAKPSTAEARKPRYDQRGPVRLPARERAAEVHRNLGWSMPVVGLPAHRLPADVWTGDYDIVVADETGRVAFVRGPAEDRTVLDAILERARR